MSKLFVVSGCSGVGKNTVLNQVMARRKDLRFSVSATTRAPRPGEVDGVHYYYVTEAEFQGMIDRGEMLEYDFHNDTYYGTPLHQVKQGADHIILDIEPVGAFNVRSAYPDAVLIFIKPPSMEELERRLRSRGDTSEEQMLMRLKRAAWELEQAPKYDYVVVNDVVEDCVNEILNIIAEKADE